MLQHTHTQSCYNIHIHSRVTTYTYTVVLQHTHTQSCYNTHIHSRVTTHTYTAVLQHTHTQSCYKTHIHSRVTTHTYTAVLQHTHTVVLQHTHTQSCYNTHIHSRVTTHTYTVVLQHTHTQSCYNTHIHSRVTTHTYTAVLQHTHTQPCYNIHIHSRVTTHTYTVVLQHTHTQPCYNIHSRVTTHTYTVVLQHTHTVVLQHTHTQSCYNTHTQSCYNTHIHSRVTTYTVVLQHTHTQSCYNTHIHSRVTTHTYTVVLQHTHTQSCYNTHIHSRVTTHTYTVVLQHTHTVVLQHTHTQSCYNSHIHSRVTTHTYSRVTTHTYSRVTTHTYSRVTTHTYTVVLQHTHTQSCYNTNLTTCVPLRSANITEPTCQISHGTSELVSITFPPKTLPMTSTAHPEICTYLDWRILSGQFPIPSVYISRVMSSIREMTCCQCHRVSCGSRVRRNLCACRYQTNARWRKLTIDWPREPKSDEGWKFQWRRKEIDFLLLELERKHRWARECIQQRETYIFYEFNKSQALLCLGILVWVYHFFPPCIFTITRDRLSASRWLKANTTARKDNSGYIYILIISLSRENKLNDVTCSNFPTDREKAKRRWWVYKHIRISVSARSFESAVHLACLIPLQLGLAQSRSRRGALCCNRIGNVRVPKYCQLRNGSMVTTCVIWFAIDSWQSYIWVFLSH